MKKLFKLSALALLATAMTVSCEKETAFEDEIVQHYPAKTFTLTFAQPDTKVAITNEGKTTWEVGDEIMIHGGDSGKARQKVTLTADDISADGKKATITVVDMAPYDRTDAGVVSKYYAQYPASLVPEGSMYYECRFTGTNAPLMAACDVDDTFVFYNLCGIITFEADGEFDKFVFAGNGGETVGYSSVYQVRVRNDEGGMVVNYNKPGNGSGDPVAMKEFAADKIDGVNYIYLPAGANFSGGFNFKFYDGEDLVKVAKTETAVNVAAGKILALGDITGKLETYVPPTSSDHEPAAWAASATDLSVGLQAPANSYVLTAPGAYKIPAVKGNTTEAVGNVFDVELLWETYNNAEEVTANSVIAEVDFDNDNLYFKTPDALKAGNALIAAKSYDGKILWSWHIWIPATEITSNTYNLYPQQLMDRNLGALVAATTTSVPVESFGLHYEWGRKDPFVGAKSISSSSFAKVSGTAISVGYEMTVAQTIANPTTYAVYKESDSWGNWLSPANDATLWQDDVKTVYDPCPAGYKVPKRDSSQPLHSDDLSTVEGWSDVAAEGDNAAYYTLGNPVTVFPYSGLVCENGKYMDYPGARSFTWTSSCNSDVNPRIMDVRSGTSTHKMTTTVSSRGCTVRCVKIDGWEDPVPPQPATPDEDAVTEVTFWQSTFAAVRGSESELIVKDDGETSATFTKDKLTFITGGGQFKFKAENPGERVQLGGTGIPGSKNCLQFKVAGNGILKVWARSSSTDVRAVKVAVGDQEVAENPVLESKGAVAVNTIKITANVNDLINVYSKSSAINVYDMAWIPEGNEDPQPEVNPFTSNVAWAYNNTNKSYDEYAIHATYDGKTYRYVHNLKLGTGSAAGSAEFTLPAGATKVTFYAVGWKGTPGNIKFTVNEKEYAFDSIASDDVITGNGPYNLTVTDAMKYSFFLDAALAAQTTMTVTSLSPGYRVYIFGVNSSEEEIPVPQPAYELQWGWYSAGDGSTLWTANVTAISVSHPDGYGMVRGLAMDDEYIYLPKSSGYAAIAAVKITDPNTQVKGSVSGVSVGSTFQTSFVRMMKNSDPEVNGGKDMTVWGSEYLLSNASIANVVTPNGEKSNGWDACSLVVSSTKAVNTWGYNFFEFNGKEYIAYARLDGKKACIEIIEKGASLSATIEAPEVLMQIPIHSAASLDSELTTGGLADCAVRVIDGVPYIAALTRDGALTVYKLVLK